MLTADPLVKRIQTAIHHAPSVINTVLPKIIQLRHELHQHPEIRFEEYWTSDRIATFLEGEGISLERGFARGTGIVAEIHGAQPGPTVALRADMDALEIQEQSGLLYASQFPNRMHACGHDGHSATLCGVALVLQHLDGQFPGRIRLIFQPAEEIAAGGRLIVEEGVLDDVDVAFALHGWPDLAVGQVATRPGWLMAGARDFSITVNGAGCHGADPAVGIDPVVVAAHIITSLQTIVSREINPWEAGVVTVGMLQAGHTTNIIPDTAKLSGTFRSIRPDLLDAIKQSIERIAVNTAHAFRAQATVEFGNVAYPPLHNDPETTQLACEILRETLGTDNVLELDAPVMAAEDFAYYLQKVPGVFLYVGVNPTSGQPYPPLHNARYDFSDEALPIAMHTLASLTLGFLIRSLPSK